MLRPTFTPCDEDSRRRDLHRTTVHLSGFGGPRFEELKKALYDVQIACGDGLKVQIHRRQPAAEVL